MIIGTTEIRTPQEYSWGYDAEWRHKLCVAQLGADSMPMVPIPNDLIMQYQKRYLSEVEEGEFDDRATRLLMSPGKNRYKSVIKANRIYGSTGQGQVKNKVEAMLLCPEMTFEMIAEALNTEPDDIHVYERLFFNARDEEGKLVGSIGLREYLALRGAVGVQSPADTEMYHRQVAFEGGAKALYNQWAWHDPTGQMETSLNEVDMYRMVMPHIYKLLDQRLRFDTGIDGRTLALLVDSIRAAFADLRRNGMLSDSDTVSSEEFSLQLLKLMQPHMVIPDAAALNRRNAQLSDKLDSIKQSNTSGIAAGAQTLENITTQLNNK